MEAYQSVERATTVLQPGDHLCCIYDGARQFRHTLVSIVREGLRLGQIVVFLYANHDPKPALHWFQKSGVDVEQALAHGRLILRDCVEIFGTPDGFDPDRALANLRALLAQAQAGSRGELRVVADMRWCFSGTPDKQAVFYPELARFEQLLSRPAFLQASILCLYDAHFDPMQTCAGAVEAHHQLFAPLLNAELAPLLNTGSLAVQPGAEKALADAHAALVETETRYRAIFNAATESIILYDLDGVILDLNRVACERLGYAREEMLGRHAGQFEAPELAGQFPLRFELLGRYGAITFETVHCTRSSELFPVEVNASLIEYDGRRVMLSIARDITDRKRAELDLVNVNQALASANDALNSTNAALLESEQKFRSLVQSSPDGIALIDTAGRIIEFNTADEHIFGCPASAVLGSSLADFYFKALVIDPESPEDRHALQAKIDAVLRTGQADWLSAEHEHEVRRADGQRRYIQSTCFPIDTQRGYMIGIITRDVTAHRLTQMELDHYRQRLEVMVADRTIQLQREIRERRQVEENLQIMLREVHHRVKNNLNVIIALISMQKEAQTDPRVTAVFEDLQTRAYSMALVHESLYRSPNLAQVDFSSYLRTLLDYLSTAYAPYGSGQPVSLRVQAENIALRIETAVPCGLMVNELVTNAMKYAFPAGHDPCNSSIERLGEISVLLERQEGPSRDAFVLTVRDNGAGFPPGFDWQTAPTLGLQLVRVLARQLGGSLSLDTAMGLTWRFEFEERP